MYCRYRWRPGGGGSSGSASLDRSHSKFKRADLSITIDETSTNLPYTTVEKKQYFRLNEDIARARGRTHRYIGLPKSTRLHFQLEVNTHPQCITFVFPRQHLASFLLPSSLSRMCLHWPDGERLRRYRAGMRVWGEHDSVNVEIAQRLASVRGGRGDTPERRWRG